MKEGYGYYIMSTKGDSFKSCPFCGREEQEIYETGCGADAESYFYKYAIFCDCGAKLSGVAHVRSAADTDRKYVVSYHAEKAWNTRV